jgi:hypothetical protein
MELFSKIIGLVIGAAMMVMAVAVAFGLVAWAVYSIETARAKYQSNWRD